MKNISCKEQSIPNMLYYITRCRLKRLPIVLLLFPLLLGGCGKKPVAKAGDLQGNIAVS